MVNSHSRHTLHHHKYLFLLALLATKRPNGDFYDPSIYENLVLLRLSMTLTAATQGNFFMPFPR